MRCIVLRLHGHFSLILRGIRRFFVFVYEEKRDAVLDGVMGMHGLISDHFVHGALRGKDEHYQHTEAPGVDRTTTRL